MREIEFGGPCLLLDTPNEVNLGMGMFARQYLLNGSLPSYSLLFKLAGQYNTFTMDGVPFPIYVILYDQNWNVLSIFTAQPNTPNFPLPPSTYWMYETAIH